MKKSLLLAALIAICVSCASAQVDQQKWFVFPNTYMFFNGTNPWCENASQAVKGGGYLTLTTVFGSNVCQGQTTSYTSAGMFTRSFQFTQGTVKMRVKAAGTGVHSGLGWLWGGDVTSTGYPNTCRATLEAMTDGNAFFNCSTTAVPSYEIDFAEVVPTPFGLSTNANNIFVWTSGTAVAQTGSQAVNVGTDMTAAFHTYELLWNSTQLIFKFDGSITTTVTYSLNVPMFLIMDQEIDSHAPPSSSGSYPQSSQYDYVRVCSDPTATCNIGDPTMIFEDEFNGGTYASGKTMTRGTVVQ